MLEDHHRVRILERRLEHATRIVDRGRREHLDAGNVRIPVLEAVRVLGGELSPASRRHPDHQRTLNCPPDMWRNSAAVLTIWSSARRLKLTVITSTIGRSPPSAAPMPVPTKRARKAACRGCARAELLQEALRHRVGAAVLADVLAHQEDSGVTRQRLVQRLAQCFAVGRLHRAGPVVYTSRARSSTGSQVPASANATPRRPPRSPPRRSRGTPPRSACPPP